MGKKVEHILVTCHEEDREDMTILMVGLATHSDFINWNLNEFYDACIDLDKDETDAPALQVWHGFTTEKHAWDVMASLLASVSWRHEGAITIKIERDGALGTYALRQFFHAVREGKIK